MRDDDSRRRCIICRLVLIFHLSDGVAFNSGTPGPAQDGAVVDPPRSSFRVHDKPQLRARLYPIFFRSPNGKATSISLVDFCDCFKKAKGQESPVKLLCAHFKMFPKCTALTDFF